MTESERRHRMNRRIGLGWIKQAGFIPKVSSSAMCEQCGNVSEWNGVLNGRQNLLCRRCQTITSHLFRPNKNDSEPATGT